MRRRALLAGLAALLVVVLGGVGWWVARDDTPEPGPTALAQAVLGSVDVEPEPDLPVVFSRTIYAAAGESDAITWIDHCKGAVAIDYGEQYPTLVAEHDYCGGSDWIPKLQVADRVALDGPGIDPGTYEVSQIAYGVRDQARIADAPPGDLVLQTCVSKTQIVLVAINRVA